MKYTIYIKLSNECNLNCLHCYNSENNNSQIINYNDIINFIELFSNLHINDKIIIIFHGGQPFLQKNLHKIKFIIQKLKNLKNIKFTITTNLCYELTEQRLNLLEKFNNKQISTSWDYKIRFQNNNEELWQHNINLLKQKNFNIRIIICLTNILISELTPKELFERFSSLKIYELNFERITANGNAKLYDLKPLNIKMRKWLLDAYVLWKNSYSFFNIALFNQIIESIYHKKLLGCRARCCQQHVLTINPDGTIAGCPNIASNIYSNIFNYSNQNNEFCKLKNLQKLKRNQCYTCKYYTICNGDCFQLNFDQTGCPGLKQIIQYQLSLNETL